jgi:hypothetical protein
MIMLGQAKSLVFGVYASSLTFKYCVLTKDTYTQAARKSLNYVRAIPGASAAMATTVSKDQDTVISSALKLIGFAKKGISGS